MAVTDFWAKLNQVLVTAASDLYARETQARISTPQDTLDARHDITEAKLEVMKLPPRRLKNQMRDSDLPSDIERVRHIFTGWRTFATFWRATATVRRLQRRDKTKKHTEQARRISDAWTNVTSGQPQMSTVVCPVRSTGPVWRTSELGTRDRKTPGLSQELTRVCSRMERWFGRCLFLRGVSCSPCAFAFMR